MKILIVEDDYDSALLMQLALSKEEPSAALLTANGWRQCQDLGVQLSSLDVVVLDLMLIDGTGVQAWEEIKRHCHNHPALWICSAMDAERARELLDTLHYPYQLMPKPLDRTRVRELMTTIKKKGQSPCKVN